MAANSVACAASARASKRKQSVGTGGLHEPFRSEGVVYRSYGKFVGFNGASF